MTASDGGMTSGPEPAARDLVLARREPRWSAERTEDNLALTFRRIERGRRLRRLGGAGVVTLGALALVAGLAARRPVVPPMLAVRVPETLAGPRRQELPEGATVALAGPRARVTSSGEGVELDLGGGPAELDVPTRAARPLVVRTARVQVAILSARFELRPAGDRVSVSVRDGEVAVTWPGGGAPATLARGEAGVFPPEAAPGVSPEAADVAPRARAGTPEQRARFRALVARRDYAGAYRSLVASPGVAEHSPEDLLLAADAARLSGHPASAVLYLRRLLGDHPRDVRGPVAAFTLGRVLLVELARPREAADAFALAYRLSPDGPLAADALGREVEASARAGDDSRARRLARVYLTRFPSGPRVADVRRAAGLE